MWDAFGQHTGSAALPVYNRAIAFDADPTLPRARARRAVIVVLLAQLAFAALIPALPGAPGAVRVGGVSLLWWYAAVGAPVFSALAVAVVRR